ncbi:hypothetical protein OF83DRAFT_1060481 [Amylostereum chailletii]|nr:hypothetical protein OF83DRAFT_1060481 [Amylostereum chailletii]
MDIDREGPPHHGPPHHPGHPHGLPLPEDFDSSTCVSGNDWDFPEEPPRNPLGNWPSNLATTHLEVPVDNNRLFLFSHGNLAQGDVRILPADQESDKVSVDVEAYYHTREALDRVNVCGLQSADKGNGFGVYTPHSHHHNRHDIVHFRLTVYLPLSSGTRFIPNFFTTLPQFVQTLDGISPAFEFGNLTLVSANAPIHALGDVVADQIILHTSNSPISGSFNTTSQLSLTSSNGPIDVTAASFNDDPSQAHTMILHTSNARIAATVFLLNTVGATSAFNASTTTSNSPLIVEYASLPSEGAVLSAVAHTSNSPARLTLPPAFEGTFFVRTSLLGAAVDRRDVEDPTGRGRQRKVEMNVMRRGVAYGKTSWEPSEDESKAGFASVTTSNGPAQLVL